jgi:hypothetical protein
MRRLALAATLVVLAVGGRAIAQQAPSFEGMRSKAVLSEEDRVQLRQWLAQTINAMITNTDPDRRGMVAARDSVLSEVRGASQSQGYRQTLAEEAVKIVKDSEKKAVSQEARTNLFMLVAELRSFEGIPLLTTALEKDQYPAARYWAARGMDAVADTVVEKVSPRLEQEMSVAAGKAFDGEVRGVEAYLLLEMLGKFDHEVAHDVLADSVSKFVQKASAADPIDAQILIAVIPSLEKAYTKEVRPEGKVHVLTAYAYLCAWVMPPVTDPALMFNINASLEKITGEKVGFPTTGDAVAEKMALVEWAEKLVRDKKIPKRPTLPPAVEDTVKELRGAATGGAAP